MKDSFDVPENCKALIWAFKRFLHSLTKGTFGEYLKTSDYDLRTLLKVNWGRLGLFILIYTPS